MNARTVAMLLIDRQRDLAANEEDIRKYSARLAELMAERNEIKDDIAGLERLANEG